MPRDNQATRSQRENRVAMLGLAKFIVVVFLLWNGIKIGYECLTHPTLHPRIYQALFELLHYHPTMLKLGWIVLGMLIISWRMYSTAMARSGDKKRLKVAVPLKSDKSLELPTTLTFNLDAATTWENLLNTFPGLPVEINGIRATHWRLLQNDQSRMQLTMSLTYDRISTGQASGKPDPRILNCVATVKGRGVSSNVLLSFVAEGMLDNRVTPAIIDETKAALKRALDLELKMTAPMDEFDRAIEAQEKKDAIDREKLRQAEDENFRQESVVEAAPEVAPEAPASGYSPYTNFDGSTF